MGYHGLLLYTFGALIEHTADHLRKLFDKLTEDQISQSDLQFMLDMAYSCCNYETFKLLLDILIKNGANIREAVYSAFRSSLTPFSPAFGRQRYVPVA